MYANVSFLEQNTGDSRDIEYYNLKKKANLLWQYKRKLSTRLPAKLSDPGAEFFSHMVLIGNENFHRHREMA